VLGRSFRLGDVTALLDRRPASHLLADGGASAAAPPAVLTAAGTGKPQAKMGGCPVLRRVQAKPG
jgi:hypothetical protein